MSAVERRAGPRVELALVERMRDQHAVCCPGSDVFLIAADCEDQAARKGVAKVNGLFVVKVRERHAALERARATRQQSEPREMERYAGLWTEIFRMAITKGWTPVEVARALEAARSHGFELLNPMVAPKLAELGDSWQGGIQG